MIGKIYAKSDNTLLTTHSESVCGNIKKITTKLSIQYTTDFEQAALLHDIGKCTSQFQKALKKGDVDENDKKSLIKFTHNQVSWAFLRKYTNLNVNILYAIYWHHGIYSTGSKVDNAIDDRSILQNVTPSDIDTMKLFLGNYKVKIVENSDIKKIPRYYDDSEDDNIVITKQLLLYSLVSADRTSVENIDSTISKIPILYTRPQNYDQTRYDRQSAIVEKIDDCKTVIIKAPAEFGKILLGLMWSLKRNKKLIWICPSNMVVASVYNSIINELKSFGISDVSVEKYTTSEVQESTHNSKGFDSDIIVTNIDSFLNPILSNSNMHRLYMLMGSDVVFDEFHELVNKSPIFSCFINIMKLRHTKTNSNTVLLSATPMKINGLWDMLGKKTTMLPNEHEHYPAIHSIKYNYKVDTNHIDILKDCKHLYVFNTIKKAQANRENNAGLLIHSNYLDDDKKRIVDELYDKHSKSRLSKENVFGTQVIRTSWDISFERLTEYVFSPEMSMQVLGRCNRHGLFGECDVHTINDTTEHKIKDSLYNNKLSNKWFDFMVNHFNNKSLTLDEIYILYNNFYIYNNNDISNYLYGLLSKSRGLLSGIYPIKYEKIETNTKRARSNKLRSNGSEMFFICKKRNSNDYIDPISVQIHLSIDDDFDEDGATQGKMNNVIKKMKDIRFDYSDIIKKAKKSKRNITLDKLRECAKYSHTPYIRFDVEYDTIFGVIKKIK